MAKILYSNDEERKAISGGVAVIEAIEQRKQKLSALVEQIFKGLKWEDERQVEKGLSSSVPLANRAQVDEQQFEQLIALYQQAHKLIQQLESLQQQLRQVDGKIQSTQTSIATQVQRLRELTAQLKSASADYGDGQLHHKLVDQVVSSVKDSVQKHSDNMPCNPEQAAIDDIHQHLSLHQEEIKNNTLLDEFLTRMTADTSNETWFSVIALYHAFGSLYQSQQQYWQVQAQVYKNIETLEAIAQQLLPMVANYSPFSARRSLTTRLLSLTENGLSQSNSSYDLLPGFFSKQTPSALTLSTRPVPTSTPPKDDIGDMETRSFRAK